MTISTSLTVTASLPVIVLLSITPSLRVTTALGARQLGIRRQLAGDLEQPPGQGIQPVPLGHGRLAAAGRRART